jgi:hypothetical protein
VPVPTGSRIDIVLTATKPFASADVRVRPAATDAAPTPVVWASVPDSDGRAVAFALENVAADTDVLVRLTDADGLGNREPVAVVITVVPDEPPRLALRLAGVGPAVTPQAVLPIEGTITDDHAVAAAAVRLDWGTGSRDLTIEQAAGGATAVTLDANRPVRVGLADLGLAVGSRLAVTVLARDDCGLATGPNTAVTETWTLDVVAPDTLRAALEAREVMMRRRFEAAVGDLAGARDAGPAADGADLSGAGRTADDRGGHRRRPHADAGDPRPDARAGVGERRDREAARCDRCAAAHPRGYARMEAEAGP